MEPEKNLLMCLLRSNLKHIHDFVSGEVDSRDSLLRSVDSLLWLRGLSDSRLISIEDVCANLAFNHERLVSDAATRWLKLCPDRYQLLHGIADQYMVHLQDQAISVLREIRETESKMDEAERARKRKEREKQREIQLKRQQQRAKSRAKAKLKTKANRQLAATK